MLNIRAVRKKIIDFFTTGIWRVRLKDLSRPKAFAIKQLRILFLTVHGFSHDKCPLRASALTFYSLLSIVPVAAMAFGIAKGFGWKTSERCPTPTKASAPMKPLRWKSFAPKSRGTVRHPAAWRMSTIR